MPCERLGEFVAKARAQVRGDFQVHGLQGEPRGVELARAELLFPVTFIQPESGNEVALGLDLGSELQRRAALLEAESSDEVWSSEPVELRQGSDSPALLLALPVRHNGSRRPRPTPARCWRGS